jgi:hypothetical protein
MYPPPGPPPPQWGRPAGPSAAWAVVLWVVAAMSLAAALLFGVISAAGFWSDNHLDNEGVTTSATVTKVDDSTSTITVEFTTEDNSRVTTELTLWPDESPAVDDQIDITYDPYDPSYAIRAGSNEDQLLATGFGFVALFGLAVAVAAGVGAVLIHRARGKASRFHGYY